MKHIHILYSSGGGNTALVVKAVSEKLTAAGFTVTTDACQTTTPETFAQADAIILANPTYSHGELESKMKAFLPTLEGVKIKDMPCAVIALGDTAYDLDYCAESRHILTDFLVRHEAVPILMPLIILGAPLPALAKQVPTWTDQYITNLTNYDDQNSPYRILRGGHRGQYQYRKNVS